MKIVISSSGPDLKAAVDPRFGRAAYLLLYDTAQKEVVEVIDNAEGQDVVQGAGISAAGLLAQKGVEVILTGRVGPKAMVVVDKAGIRVVSGVRGAVDEAIHAFLATSKEPFTAEAGRAPSTVPTPGGCRSSKRGQGGGGGSGQGRGHGGRGMARETGK